MFELATLGLAMKAAYWLFYFWVSAPAPVVTPPPTQTQFEIAFPSIPKEPIAYKD